MTKIEWIRNETSNLRLDSSKEFIWNINKSELEQRIQKLKTSIESFKTRKDYVFEMKKNDKGSKRKIWKNYFWKGNCY